ncbi:unnamed protein product [Urochloa humidicola]
MDCDMEKPEEEECLRIWLWTADPDGIPTTGTLHIEEPVTLPEEGYAESLMELGMPMGALRSTYAKALAYDVIIHVDRVLDYSVPPADSSRREIDSPISGHPDEEREEEWPPSHPFSWTLGVPDGETQRGVNRQRVSVYDRLGDRGQDRSPPHGGAGGAGNLGPRQRPPSGPHDLQRRVGGGGGSHSGSSSHHSRGWFRQRQMQWKIKEGVSVFERLEAGRKSQGKEAPNGKSTGIGSVEPVGSYFSDDCWAQAQREADPMLEEARYTPIGGRSRPDVSQRSVEPTATHRGSAVTHPNGENMIPVQDSDQGDLIAFEEEYCHGQQQSSKGNAVHAQAGVKHATGDGPMIMDTLMTANDSNKDMTGQQLPHGPFSESVDSLLDGLPFDLNKAVATVEFGTVGQPTGAGDRHIFGTAESRLNKDAKEGPSRTTAGKTVTRFAIPLKKALLGNPMVRAKGPSAKKSAHSATVEIEKKNTATRENRT